MALVAACAPSPLAAAADLLVDDGSAACIYPNQGNRILGERLGERPPVLERCVVGRRAFGDIDGDGLLDEVRSNGVFLGSGDGAGRVRTVAFEPEPREAAVACGDLDGDGLADVLVGTRGVRLFLGRPGGRLEPRGPVLPFTTGGSRSFLRLRDLDGDGVKDVLGWSRDGPLLAFGTISRPPGAGSVAVRFEAATGALPEMELPVVGDLDGNGLADLIFVSSPETGVLALHVHPIAEGRSLGRHATFTFSVASRPSLRARGVAVGDIDRDGRQDVVAGAEFPRLAVFLGRGDGGLEPPVFVRVPEPDAPAAQYTALLLDDLDEDGCLDLVAGRDALLGTALYWGTADGFVVHLDLDRPTLLPIRAPRRLEALRGLRREFLRGDADGDGAVAISDAVAVLEQLFGGRPVACGDASDADDSGRLDLADAVRVLENLFRGGRPPPYPYPRSGGDPTADVTRGQGTGWDLGCSRETFQWRWLGGEDAASQREVQVIDPGG